MSTVIILVAGLVTFALITLHFLLILFTPTPTSPTPSEQTYTTAPSSSPSLLPNLSTKPSIALSIIIPAYNERDRLPIMLNEAMQYFTDRRQERGSKAGLDGGQGEEGVQGVVELIVVDDGSGDGTDEVARGLAGEWEGKGVEGVEIRVVRLEKNRGKGGAVQHGVLHSRGHLILFADADGATRFSDISILLDGMQTIKDEHGHGMVVGSRAHLVNSEAVVKRSKLRNLLMHGFHIFLRTLGVDGIRDTQCGFKLFTRPTAALLFPQLHLPRWSFDVELLLLASLTTPPIPVLEVPVAWHEVNGSKIRLGWDSIGMARDLLVLRGNLFLGRWVVPQRQDSGYENGQGEGSVRAEKQEGGLK